MTHRSQTCRFGCLLATLLCAGAVAQDTDVPLPARVITNDLETHSARPFVIEDSHVIAWSKPTGIPTPIERADVLAIVVGPADSRATDSRWRDVVRRSGERSAVRGPELRLHNGHVIPGTMVARDDTIYWRHPRLGTFPIDVEEVSALRLVEGVDIPIAETLDQVVLANGDSIEGLILELADPLPIERTIGEETTITKIPMERVAAIALVNPPIDPTGILVWTDDGARFSVEDVLVGDDGYVRIVRPSPSAHAEVEFQGQSLRGILFDPGAVIPLASLEAQVDVGKAKDIRHWAPPPRIAPGFWPLGAAEIELDGPIRARWTLPEKGCTVSARAELPIDAIHGNFELVVRDGGTEVLRRRVDRNEPVHRILHQLTSNELEIELEMGEGGPVQDDLLLHDAVVTLPRNEGS